MKKIETLQQLQAEKRLTRERIAQLELLIEEDISEIKNSLNPIRAAGHAVKNLISSERDGIVGESIGLTVDALIKKLLLRKSNWMFKLIIAFLIKNLARNTVSKNSGSILEWIKAKLRKPGGNNNIKEYFRDPTSSSEWETY